MDGWMDELKCAGQISLLQECIRNNILRKLSPFRTFIHSFIHSRFCNNMICNNAYFNLNLQMIKYFKKNNVTNLKCAFSFALSFFLSFSLSFFLSFSFLVSNPLNTKLSSIYKRK